MSQATYRVNLIFPTYIKTALDSKDSVSNTHIKLGSLCLIGKQDILGKIIEINSKEIILKPLEKLDRIKINDQINFISIPEITFLYPGIFGKIIDVLGNEYNKSEIWQKVLPHENQKIDFIPVVQNGEKVEAGQKIGYAQIHEELKFWITAPSKAKATNIEAGTFDMSQSVCKLGDQALFLHTKIIERLELNPNFTQSLRTQNSLVDTLFPILLGSQNLTLNCPWKFLKSLLNCSNVGVIILITNRIYNLEKPNLIQILDNFDQPKLCCKKAQLLANTISQSGYNVLIINELKQTIEWNIGEGHNIDGEYYSITAIDLQPSSKKYQTKLEFEDEKLDFENSFSNLPDIDKYLLEIGNIQFIGDFKKFRELLENREYHYTAELLEAEKEINFESVHRVLQETLTQQTPSD